jgi:hypothetical protein
MFIRAVGNLYGFPPAGQNFSKEFDKCLRECGYENTPWDPKFFFKWVNDKPIIVIAHSDDFRWFGPDDLISEWDHLVATFNKHKYEVTDATDKEFVGIHIYHDKDFNYYMDQTRMITSIVEEANIAGARNEKLPYPMLGLPLSKEDGPTTDEQEAKCSKYPYRKVIGQLMYGMVHTIATTQVLDTLSSSDTSQDLSYAGAALIKEASLQVPLNPRVSTTPSDPKCAQIDIFSTLWDGSNHLLSLKKIMQHASLALPNHTSHAI